jgi:hypothetical protein
MIYFIKAFTKVIIGGVIIFMGILGLYLNWNNVFLLVITIFLLLFGIFWFSTPLSKYKNE